MIRSLISQGRELLGRPVSVRVALSTGLLLVAFWLVAPWGPRIAQHRFDGAPLGVHQLIQRVRSELAAAETDILKTKRSALFELQEMEMEMEIHYVVRAGGEAKLEVVGIGGGLDTSSERVQKLKLRWTVTPKKGGSVSQGLVSGPPTEHITHDPTTTSPSAPTK